jgi:hypothetical protein
LAKVIEVTPGVRPIRLSPKSRRQCRLHRKLVLRPS